MTNYCKWTPRMRVVLGTNVFISALIMTGDKPPSMLYRASLRGEVELVTSIA